ncbi:AGAP008580-PA-like protein [Anopheles sinensis]|uniref:AGAP008580-PA-like protein n=1 Tax=Anopheles sinensis TaxID=74873 RepID=A0A084VFH2_ANOSI|nr:AGAP008580-PA-like protein [Anopheles sinensis]
MEVVQRLKDIEPKHAEIKRRVINFVYSAKLNVVERMDEFYIQLFTEKEGSLTGSIVLEDEMLYHLDHQVESAERSCIDTLRNIVDSNMNVAGVGYTNCINSVQEGLERELERVLKLLQFDESKILYQRLLDVFEGENIIYDPERILAKLKDKGFEIDAMGSDCLSGVFEIVEKFAAALDDLRNAYQTCLTKNESILKIAYASTMSQLTNICLGTIINN